MKGAELKSKDKEYGWRQLLLAASEGHEAMVKPEREAMSNSSSTGIITSVIFSPL